MKVSAIRTGIVALLLLLPPAAHAQQKGNIELKQTSEVQVTRTNAAGQKETKWVPVQKAKVVPGDVVMYTTTYRNNGKKLAENIVITNPIPEHMDYVDGSAEGSGTKIDFSADGGKTWGSAGSLAVVDAQGKKRPAGPGDYTNIRWTLAKPLPPGGTGTVTFKARVQ